MEAKNLSQEQKEKESQSLRRVLDGTHSTRFAQQLVNNIVEAQNTGNLTQQEAPDFVVYMKYPNKNQLYAVGIEQFDATIYSSQKGKQRHSDDQTLYNEFQRIQAQRNPNQITMDDVNFVLKCATRMGNQFYGDLIASVRYSLQNHLPKIPSYRKKIRQNCSNQKIKIGFLMDITINVSGLFYCTPHDIHNLAVDDNIMYYDIVEMLRQSKDVDVWILSLHYPNNIHKTLILRHNKLIQDIRGYGYQICKYCGEDKNIITRQKKDMPFFKIDVQPSNNPETFNLLGEVNILRTDQEKAIQEACKELVSLMKAEKPFIATRGVIHALSPDHLNHKE